jgi:hypothetical protein
MESGCADGRNSRKNCPENGATIVSRSADGHRFRQLFGPQNCLPEEARKRFAALSKDTSFEEECTPAAQSKLSRIRGNRNEGWKPDSGLCSHRLSEYNIRDTKQWHDGSRDTSWVDTTLVLSEEYQYGAEGTECLEE